MSERNGEAPAANFIRNRIEADLASGRCSQVVTRFPPEPNGYLHIGHAKSAYLNFDLAQDYGGIFRLRFDDTNPGAESDEYRRGIEWDMQWLGCQWDGEVRYTSDYFPRLYEYAVQLLRSGAAYICSLDMEAIRQQRGTLTTPGSDSPWRDRSADENLRLFAEMRDGRFADGTHVLRARIDMGSPNLNLRDPVLYRIRRQSHYRTGDQWPIYPTYDFAHCLADAIEAVTHSLCTLEFEDHRPLYDWLLQQLKIPNPPQQIEFARLQLEGTITSKRRLSALVEAGTVDGWDDPRLPTLAGLRRLGCPPEALRDFCHRIGVTRADSWVHIAQLQFSIRDDLDRRASRAMAVQRPLQLIVENWPEERQQLLNLPLHPRDAARGERSLPFERLLWIEREDFADPPPKGYRRLAPGRAVRLRGAYVIRCSRADYDEQGEPVRLYCSCDHDSLGTKPDYPVAGVIHWLPASAARPARLRLYEPLLLSTQETDAEPAFNPQSRHCVDNALIEPEAAELAPGSVRQFERLGYFCVDTSATAEYPVWNRTVTLRDSWAKQQARQS